MTQFLKKILNVVAYMFRRDGFFTKKLVVGTMTLLMMLYVDIQCEIWNGMGLMLLVLLTFYVVCNYIIRYMDMKKEDAEKSQDAESNEDIPNTIDNPEQNEMSESETIH